MRTRSVAAAMAALALFPLAACGSDSDDSAAGWTYTDGRGDTVELDEAPDVIVAQTSMAAALTDLGVEGIAGVFGPLVGADGDVDPQAAGLDPASVEDVTGGAYGEVLTEDIAKLAPDVVITMTYDGEQLWYLGDKPAEDLASRFGLIVQSYQDKGIVGLLDDTEKLAKALGADVESDEVEQAHADFEAAADRLRSIGEQLGDRKILVISADTENFYVSNPDVSNDLKYYRDELGLPLVTPTDVEMVGGGYFETLSFENADKYAGDIALWDARIGEAGLAALDAQPVWGTVAAAQNDAYVAWDSVLPPSYAAQATAMNDIADGLEKFL